MRRPAPSVARKSTISQIKYKNMISAGNFLAKGIFPFHPAGLAASENYLKPEHPGMRTIVVLKSNCREVLNCGRTTIAASAASQNNKERFPTVNCQAVGLTRKLKALK